ncbi:UvrD-helicase domain-containing protein [Patescibacteria group bacterium]|nr:UvrD-helicase domain-containing protein [Patescibacteria group bacterium]MBU4580392.1 UvrD-helicase domain-containing protein [Patescibacteria group bacterium]
MPNSDILEGLNEKQRDAVTHPGGPLLIVAGPGSGKTRVLTHRVAYLIKELHINPDQILGVTFTNKAAEEMRIRLRKLLSDDHPAGFAPKGPTIGTFHSFGNMVLRREAKRLGMKSDFVIYDEDDSISQIKKTMEALQINPKQFSPTSVKYSISGAKNELIGASQFQEQARGLWQEQVAKIYARYQENLKKNNALDFDDLISKLHELFKDNNDVLKKYQDRFFHILVDEYQDTNLAQYTLIKMLASANRNICVVGDTDQGIYSWRGADIRNILAFEKDWPEAKIIFLEENYRSTQRILDAAQGLISKNVLRHDKKIYSQKLEGHPLFIYEAADSRSEANFISRAVQSLIIESAQKPKEERISFRDCAVFYRTNAQSRLIEESFINEALPYRIVGGVRFYARREVKDILSYLKIIQNSSDLVSLARVINVPARGIGEKSEKIIFDNLAKSEGDLHGWVKKGGPEEAGIGAKVIESLKKFTGLISEIRDDKSLNLEKAIKKIMVKTDYAKYLEAATPEKEERMENLKELIAVAKKYSKMPLKDALVEFLAEASLFEETGRKINDDAINLMTLHSAKGLEFKVVFIVGLEEGILPHSRSLADIAQLEEERRLLYVGITRAKEKLYLLLAQRRSLGDIIQANAPSRFLREIPDHLMKKIEEELGF